MLLLHHSHIREYAYIGRSLHIYKELRNIEIRKTRNDFSVQVRNVFLLPLSLKVLRPKERGTIFLYWLFHPSHPNTCGTRYKGLREQAKTNRLPQRQVSSQLYLCLVSTLTFSKSPQILSACVLCVTSFALAILRFPSRAIVTSLSDTSACEHLC